LPCWVREQAISRTLHRHGRIPTEARRRDPLESGSPTEPCPAVTRSRD
jgi:hypothetical protein